MMSGSFSGNPKTEWLTEVGVDRTMALLEDFWYDDPDGRRWTAPKASVVNGASIPAPLWSSVGSPYTGEYRRASIVHDVACDDPTVDRKEADRMFYFACLAGGCTRAQARLLYAGVRIGAWLPHVRLWSHDAAVRPSAMRGEAQPELTDVSMQNTYREIAVDIQSRDPDMAFAELEELVDHHLQAKSNQ
jgi:hypothetical protein